MAGSMAHLRDSSSVLRSRLIYFANDLYLADGAGDRVLFTKYAGSEIEVGGDEHLIIREDDVLAVLE